MGRWYHEDMSARPRGAGAGRRFGEAGIAEERRRSRRRHLGRRAELFLLGRRGRSARGRTSLGQGDSSWMRVAVIEPSSFEVPDIVTSSPVTNGQCTVLGLRHRRRVTEIETIFAAPSAVFIMVMLESSAAMILPETMLPSTVSKIRRDGAISQSSGWLAREPTIGGGSLEELLAVAQAAEKGARGCGNTTTITIAIIDFFTCVLLYPCSKWMSLFVPERLYWIEPRCPAGRIEPEHDADDRRESESQQHPLDRHHRGESGEPGQRDADQPAQSDPDDPAREGQDDGFDKKLETRVALRADRLARPISRVRSVTVVNIMFMMPMPPTTREIPAMAARGGSESSRSRWRTRQGRIG